MTLRKVCAWCNASLGTTSEDPEAVVSHGICSSCREYFFGEAKDGETLQRFLDRLEAPILVVDRDGDVLTANCPARNLVQKELDEVRGFPGGEVMECAYARLPGGCGRTVHCDGCTIRNTVTATHADGVSRHGVEAFQNLSGPDGVQRMRILISTEKVGGVVLLRIDSMAPELQQGAG